jgi:pimeloyl-ACP methyl ester carboxylesterase
MLNYYTFGSGKPVIWLHGLLGNSLNLTPLARGVEGTHYLLDARNHGQSFHAKGMSYKTQASDLLKLVDSLNLQKFSLVGHSMGGKTAMTFSCLHPHRIEKICIMDVAPVKYLKVLEKYYNSIRNIINFLKKEDISNKTRKEIQEICLLKLENPVIANLVCSNLKGSDKAFTWRVGVDNLIEGVEEISEWEDLDGVCDEPALAIAGEKSLHTAKLSGYAEGFDIKILYQKYFPKIQADIIKDAGHFVHVDKPEDVKKSLAKFFNN